MNAEPRASVAIDPGAALARQGKRAGKAAAGGFDVQGEARFRAVYL